MRKQSKPKLACDLHCHSTYSLLDGFGSPVSIVDRAIELGWNAAALTDHGTMGNVPVFYTACRDRGIKPILGCEMYITPEDSLGQRGNEFRSDSFHLTVLALSVEGYQNLVHWVTESMQPENFYYRPRISIGRMIEIAPHPLHHNVVLSGCIGGELCQSLLSLNGNGLAAGAAYIDSMKAVFPNFFVEIQNHRIEKFMGKGLEQYEEMVNKETEARDKLLVLSQATRTPIVLTNDSHFQKQEQRKAHMAMMASKLNRWSKDETHRGEGAESGIAAHVRDYGYWTNYLRSMEKIEDATPGARGACDNALEIIKESNILLDPLDNFSYSIATSGYDDPIEKIRKRSKGRLSSLKSIYGDQVKDRFEHELAAMGGFAHYLLMMSDFIKWATSQGILTEVRGSANASIVCYCLGIHNIDSIKYKLTFERFVNPERKKLPDIDIDIEFDRYEDFMQYVKEYVAEREGEGQVQLICNYGTLSNRSTFRMVAESLGVEKEQIDAIADLLPQMIDSGLVDEEDDAYAVLRENYPEVYELATDVFDNLKNVSQHACGWIFGTKERPLQDWIPSYLIASSGTLVTQFDYKNIEKFGLNKGDFLRQKYLAVMKRCLNLLGKDVAWIKDIPLDDPETMQMIREGRTEGVFTLQGNTNRMGGIECEPIDEHGVIASVAIYRPSLTRPGYHKVYNNRRSGREEVHYPSQVAEDVLGESFGLPIFQEQILDLGYGIGFTHGDAQELLDAIKLAKGVGRGAKEAFAKIHPKFIQTAVKNGLTNEEAEATWDQVESFQGYGFNRAHATGYGIRSDRAAYLKCHHPQEFFVALLDVYPEKHKYVAGARAEGFKFVTPDINESGAGFSKGDDEKSIRVGLLRVDGVGPAALKAILAGQPYSSVDDLRERTPGTAVKVTTINNLSASGAFQSFGIQPTSDETELYRLLGFLIDKPRAMKGVKVKHAGYRTSTSGWTHRGLDRGADLTPLKSSVSKLFWVPLLEDKELIKIKASPWARVKTTLLTVIDNNGLPFTVMANEDKEVETETLNFIAKRHKGSVICIDGMIRKPFDTDGPLGFRFTSVTGAYDNEPQVFNYQGDEKFVKVFAMLDEKKRRLRRLAA